MRQTIRRSTMTLMALALMCSPLACNGNASASADGATAAERKNGSKDGDRSAIGDAALTAKVKMKLAADPQVNPFEIDVDTKDGVIRLSGTVEGRAAYDAAERVARATKGVADVRNDIAFGDVKAGDAVKDSYIGTKIKAKLTADPDVSPFGIDVDVVEGVVTLTGTVEKEAAREEAGELARSTKGVKEVRNKITVE